MIIILYFLQPKSDFFSIQVPHYGLAMPAQSPAGYAFRRVIPTLLRELMGQRELWVTLDTNDKLLAKGGACR